MLSRRRVNKSLVATTALLTTWATTRSAQSATDSGVRGVDTHAHIFEKGLEFAAQRRYAPDYDATVEMFLANLDATPRLPPERCPPR